MLLFKKIFNKNSIYSSIFREKKISQKYKKWSPGKYPMLLYVAVSMRWISIRFDAVNSYHIYIFKHLNYLVNDFFATNLNVLIPISLQHDVV